MNAETRAKEIARQIDDYLDENFVAQRLCSDDINGIASLINQALRQAEREARTQALTSVRDAIDRSDSANDYPAWKSEALIVDMINALILLEKD